MATENGNGVNDTPVNVVATTGSEETTAADPKGKGKAVAAAQVVSEDVAMDEDDEDDDEDDDEAAEDADEDDEEAAEGDGAIDLNNVVGSRTRGKVIDFAKAAEENPAEDDDDDDEDGDFEDEDDEMGED